MIIYERGGSQFFLKVFQRHGSVFPFSMAVAMPCAIVTAVLKHLVDEEVFDFLKFLKAEDAVLRNNAIWSGFMFLVGFLIVFRTSQAYNRFWDGCTSLHCMRAEWFDACSSLTAFCMASKASEDAVLTFQHTLIRLFSMLHAVALAEIEDTNSTPSKEIAAFKYTLVDVAGIDAGSLHTLKQSDAKVELVFQWIQQLIVQNIDTGVLSIAPPILSRSFQELANGMVKFHDAIKISTIPFPFPYAQTCDCMLMLHWLIVPFVTIQYTSSFWSAGLFTCLLVFILWSLNAIALELENPFGDDANDLDAEHMQTEINRHLCLLLEPGTKRTPVLSPVACVKPMFESIPSSTKPLIASSLSQVWDSLPSFEGESLFHPAKSMRGQMIRLKPSRSSLKLEKSVPLTSLAQNRQELCENKAASQPEADLLLDLVSASVETPPAVQEHCAEQIMQSSLDPCSPMVHECSPPGTRAPGHLAVLRPGLLKEGTPLETGGCSLPMTQSRNTSRAMSAIGQSELDGNLSSIFCCSPAREEHPSNPKSREQLSSTAENVSAASIPCLSNSKQIERGRPPIREEANGAIPAGFR